GGPGGVLVEGERDVLDPGLVGELLQVLGGPVTLVRQDDHEALEPAVLADLLVDLLDQTGQGLGGLAGEDADHRSGTVPSAITERCALVRAGNVVHLEGVDALAHLQAGLDRVSREAGPHHDDGNHHGGETRREAESHELLLLMDPTGPPPYSTVGPNEPLPEKFPDRYKRERACHEMGEHSYHSRNALLLRRSGDFGGDQGKAIPFLLGVSRRSPQPCRFT